MKAFHLTTLACGLLALLEASPAQAASADKTTLADLAQPRVWGNRTPWAPHNALLHHIASDELDYKTEPMRNHRREDARRGITSPAPAIHGPQFWTLPTGDHVAQFEVDSNTWFLVRYTNHSPRIVADSGFYDASTGHRLSDRYDRWDDLEKRTRKWWSPFADDVASLTRRQPRSL